MRGKTAFPFDRTCKSLKHLIGRVSQKKREKKNQIRNRILWESFSTGNKTLENQKISNVENEHFFNLETVSGTK